MDRRVTLRDQFAVVRSRLRLIVAVTILATLTAFFVSGALPRVYEAQSTLIVGQALTAPNPDYNQLLASQRLSLTYAQLATTRPVLQAVLSSLRLNKTPEELANQVSADAPANTLFVRITARDGNPIRAASIANALADELITVSPVILAQPLPGTGDTRLLSIVEPAVPPTSASSPRVLLNTALAGLLALIVAIALAFIADYLDDTVKTGETVEEVAHLPTLGKVERMKAGQGRDEMYQLATLLYPRSRAAESFRTLRTNLEFAGVDAPIRSLLIGSTVAGEGKTVVAANLSIAFAQAGRRTILLDADLRQPGVGRLFKLPDAPGLSDLLRREGVQLSQVIQATEQPNLRVITTGMLPPNPAELLGSARMRAALQSLIAEADIVVIDTPPLGSFTDAAVVAAEVDAALIVVQAGRVRRARLAETRNALDRVGARAAGVVLNSVRERKEDSAYYGSAVPTASEGEAGRT